MFRVEAAGVKALHACDFCPGEFSVLECGEMTSKVPRGMGYVWESEVNCLYRTIKLLEIGAGATEVRNMIIAEELLKEAT